MHRLDKDTSGCIVAAKSNEAHVHLVDQFSNRTNTKIYLAVCEGAPKKLQDTIFTNIGRHPVSRQKMAVVSPPVGKPAITDYEVLAVCDVTHTSLIRCHLHTGRTHQIRVHLHHIGCPIVADPIYGKTSTTSKQVERLMLHAWKLSITHPSSGDTIHCSAEIPHVFQPWLELCDPSSLT